ncbi:MAG: hypothetical protein GEV00_03550 [Actinophytocola sp.]|nr:hypothetical protein [Actinophytocola sp.]
MAFLLLVLGMAIATERLCARLDAGARSAEPIADAGVEAKAEDARPEAVVVAVEHVLTVPKAPATTCAPRPHRPSHRHGPVTVAHGAAVASRWGDRRDRVR